MENASAGVLCFPTLILKPGAQVPNVYLWERSPEPMPGSSKCSSRPPGTCPFLHTPTLTQLVAARLARKLDDQQLLALETAPDAVDAGHGGTARGCAPEHSHHVRVAVVLEEQEGGRWARGLRLLFLQAACEARSRVSTGLSLALSMTGA